MEWIFQLFSLLSERCSRGFGHFACFFFYRGGECGNEGCVVEVEMEVEMVFFALICENQEVSQGCGFVLHMSLSESKLSSPLV